MKYKKIPVPLRKPEQPTRPVLDASVLGMLYVVEVNMLDRKTGEKIKHKLLLVGCEQADIERKLAWVFDSAKYTGIVVKGVEKVREKVHFLSTVVTQPESAIGPVVGTSEGSKFVQQAPGPTEPYEPSLFAVGLSTTMIGKDEDHVLRKVGHALISKATQGGIHSSGAKLSEGSTLVIERVPLSSGYASARDVSAEINRAQFVRG